jgi:hypothetical protein
MRSLRLALVASTLSFIACGGGSSEPPPTYATSETSASADAPAASTESSTGSAQAAPVVTPTEVSALGPQVESGEEVAAWIAERVAHARDGVRDFVRIPLAEQSTGWGCRCPTHYVGGSPDEHAGGDTWLRVVNDSGSPLPEAPSETVDDEGESYDRSFGQVVSVDGYFDGEIVEEDLRGGPDGPEEYLYHLNVFHITRVHGRMETEEALDARVALLGEAGDTGE